MAQDDYHSFCFDGEQPVRNLCPEDRVLTFEFWNDHPTLENVRSVRFVIGTASRQIEAWRPGLHEIVARISPSQVSPDSRILRSSNWSASRRTFSCHHRLTSSLCPASRGSYNSETALTTKVPALGNGPPTPASRNARPRKMSSCCRRSSSSGFIFACVFTPSPLALQFRNVAKRLLAGQAGWAGKQCSDFVLLHETRSHFV